MANRHVVEPGRNVDAVDVGVAVASRVCKQGGVLDDPALLDPLAERGAATCRELLDGERAKLLPTCHLAVPCVGITFECEGTGAFPAVLAPAALPGA